MPRTSLRPIRESDRISSFGLAGPESEAFPWKHLWLPQVPRALYPGTESRLIAAPNRLLAQPCALLCKESMADT